MQQRRCLSNVNCAYIPIRHPPSPAVSTNSFADRTTIIGVLRLCNKLDATRLMKTTHSTIPHVNSLLRRGHQTACATYDCHCAPLRVNTGSPALEGRLWLSSGHRTEALACPNARSLSVSSGRTGWPLPEHLFDLPHPRTRALEAPRHAHPPTNMHMHAISVTTVAGCMPDSAPAILLVASAARDHALWTSVATRLLPPACHGTRAHGQDDYVDARYLRTSNQSNTPPVHTQTRLTEQAHQVRDRQRATAARSERCKRGASCRSPSCTQVSGGT